MRRRVGADRFPPRTHAESYALWMAAAKGAHRNGDHVAEWSYRNTARLFRRRPSLTEKARCLP